MIYIDDPQVNCNIQIWFAKNLLPELPNDETVWASGFRVWLREQGCEIELSRDAIIRNSLEFEPFYDKLRFDDDRLATVFLMKWT
jgi:hypothetical protein